VRRKTRTKNTQQVVLETIEDMTTGPDSDEYVTSTEIRRNCEATESAVWQNLKGIRDVMDNVGYEFQLEPRPRYVYWWDEDDDKGGAAP